MSINVNNAIKCVLATVVAILAAVAMSAGMAEAAGTYQLKICGGGEFASGVPPQNAGWGFTVNGIVEWGTDCNGPGMRLTVPSSNQDSWPVDGNSWWQMDAPAGTRILSWNGWARRWGKQSKDGQWWIPTMMAGGAGVDLGTTLDPDISDNAGGTCSNYNQKWFTHANNEVGFTWIRMGLTAKDKAITCGNAHRTFGIEIQTIIIRDDVNPGIDLPSGAIASGGWKKGNVTAHVNGKDTGGGLRLIEYSIDGGGPQGGWGPQFCNGSPGAYKNRIPCPGNQWYDYSINTASLTDGSHQIRAVGTEATGSQFSSNPVTFNVDNNSPSSPQNVAEQGGDGWKSQNDFNLTWTNPNQGNGSPIGKVKYQIDSGAVQEKSVGDLWNLSNIQLATDGSHQIKVWLEDAAGNQSAGTAAVETVKLDRDVPGEATPVALNGWLNKEELKTELVKWNPPWNKNDLESLIDGYAVKFTQDPQNDDPGQVKTHPAEPREISPAQLTDGNWWLITRPISGSGLVGSKAVIPEPIKIDTFAPSLKVDDAPGDAWVKGTANVKLSASDALSGIDPSQEGSGLVYQIDGGTKLAAEGSAASLGLSDTGEHTVVAYAQDVAGNKSDEKALKVKVDNLAPQLKYKAKKDPADPTAKFFLATDAHSGVKGGTVYYSVDGGKYKPLPTEYDGKSSELVAHVDDDNLPEGATVTYMAKAQDNAGNESAVDFDEYGYPITDKTPIKEKTTFEMSGTGLVFEVPGSGKALKRATYKVKKKGKIKRKKCKFVVQDDVEVRICGKKVTTVNRRGMTFAKTAIVSYASEAYVRGTLYDASGKGIANAPVQIATSRRRLDAQERVYQILSEVKTDSQGEFRYKLPAGPSRLVKAIFAGTKTLRRAESEPILLQVKGRITANLKKALIKNGQKVTVYGKISYLGEALPSFPGKKLSFQWFDPRRGGGGVWRPIKEFHTRSAKYKVTYKFRFISVRSKVKLRIYMSDDPGWSYESVASKAVTVTVLPR